MSTPFPLPRRVATARQGTSPASVGWRTSGSTSGIGPPNPGHGGPQTRPSRSCFCLSNGSLEPRSLSGRLDGQNKRLSEKSVGGGAARVSHGGGEAAGGDSDSAGGMLPAVPVQ